MGVLSDESKRRDHDLQMDARGFGTSSASSARAGPTSHGTAGQGQRDPFGGPGGRTYWTVYDKARRAQQDMGGPTWHSRQRAEQDFARAHPGYQAAFDQERYRRQFVVA